MKSRWWLIALISALAAFVMYLPLLYLRSFDFESIFYLLGLFLATLAIGIGIIARRISMKRWPNWRLFPAAAVFWAVSVSMFWSTESLRPWARWIVASDRYKNLVLQQRPDRGSGLRHIEWDGWGWAGMDTSVQLVYDPTDSLARELRLNPKGRFAEVAVRTAKAQRLGKNWYSLTLFTSETWDSDD
jgi:hypothetical protein